MTYDFFRILREPHLLRWVQAWEPRLGRESPAYRALYGIAKVRVLHRLSGPLQELKTLASELQTPRPEQPHRHARHSAPHKATFQ